MLEPSIRTDKVACCVLLSFDVTLASVSEIP